MDDGRIPIAIIGIVFTFVTIIVALGLVAGIIKTRIKSRDLSRELSQDAERRFADLGARLGKIEQRLGNLETIVIESEKHREFERKL